MTVPRPLRPLTLLFLAAVTTTTLLVAHYELGLMDEQTFENSADVIVVSVILGTFWYVGDLLIRKMLRDLSKID
jgi:hypothetical protein